MYIWAELPEFYKPMGSVEFSKRLLEVAKVAVSPGVGFGEYGEGFVRIALIENADRIRHRHWKGEPAPAPISAKKKEIEFKGVSNLPTKAKPKAKSKAKPAKKKA